MENPILRFIATSDLHYCFESDGTEAFSVSNFETALRNAYAWADSQPYHRIDALYVVGDFVMNGTEAEMRRVRRTLDTCVKPETEVTLILGSHECENEDENEAIASDRLRSIFGMEPDTHKVINGFDFIGLSSVVREFFFFGPEKQDWLHRELQKAAARRPRMPVFVFQHPHIRSTVAGEGRRGTSELTEILMDYPQVIDFSGHSHAPINSPLALHQQYFTSVNTGSFWGFDLCEYDKRGGSCPAGNVHAAQFQVVEVCESGRVTVMPFDGCSGTFYPVSWPIETPWEPDSFAFTPFRCAQRAKPPCFPETADITAHVSGTTVLLRFNQATGEVRDYRLIIRDRSSGLVIRQACVTSQYYLRTPPSQIECVFSGLNPGRYRVRVQACDFWGNKSEHEFTLMYTVKTGPNAAEAKARCATALKEAEKAGYEALRKRHIAAWSAFWNKSYVALSDDYLENIYYLYLYTMNSESRGAYPPHFTSGLWGFYHDYIPWVYYFHYNIQHMYAPLDAAGHGELADNYYALRKNAIPVFRKYAETVKKQSGLFVHDVTDRYGRGADYDSLNCTPASQIAMQMYHHYLYTGDELFLTEYALPMMLGAAEFYLDMLKKGEDGLYHIHGTTAYEGNAPTDDTLTDYVMIRALFPALAGHCEGAMRDRLNDVLAHLPEAILLPMEEEDWDGEHIAFGIGKGRRPLGDGRIFGIGYRNGKPVRKSYGDPDSPKCTYGFPDIELSPLYPAGIVGLKDRGTPMFDNMTNQLLLHETGANCGHWNMLPIYLARMGMGNEFAENCRGMLEANQGFLNGFNAESSEGGCPRGWPAWYHFTDTDTGEKHMLKTDEFTHFDFETAPIISMAIIESLLQSHEGVIRVFPAIKSRDHFSFELYTEGGFKVGGDISAEGCVVSVTALRGGSCLVCLPDIISTSAWREYAWIDGAFAEQPVVLSHTGHEEAIALSNLKAGDMILLTSVAFDSLETEKQEISQPNMQMKQCGKVSLGSPKLMGGKC